MKYLHIAFVSLCLLWVGKANSQAVLSNFELRMENGQFNNPSAYQFDVYLYNNSASSFELRAGTVSFWINATWRNAGTITPSIVSSNLVAGQQTGTSSYTNGSTDFFRKSISAATSGSGTSIAANTKVKLFTILFTNSASFASGSTPNFAWKFSGTNACGFTYTDTTTTASAIAVNSTTVTATQSNCFTPTYWTGSQWNAGSTSAGAASTSVPVSTKDAIIYSGTYSGALVCRNYALYAGSTHTLGSSTLEATGNLNTIGTLSASSGTINLTGVSSNQTSNQSITGNSIAVANLGFGTSGNGGTKTLVASVSVSNVVTQSGSAVLASIGNLTLLSSASGTARIAPLNTASAITGNIKVERYIPASYRRYRYLSSPVVGGTTLQWRDNGASTSGRGIHITGSTGTVDPSLNNGTSAYKYTENLSAGGSDINSKWQAVDGSSTLTNGQGYNVFVRGDRTKNLMLATDTVPNNTTIWVSGTYPVSPVAMPVTYNPTLGNGWNLVGNPFPSTLDWDAASGWTKTNIGNAIYIYNTAANTFGSYDGTTSTNGVTNYISSGQAFFIQANASSPALSVSESAKVATVGSNLFKGAEQNCLRIKLAQDASAWDETVIRFMDNKADSFNANEDVRKLANSTLNLGSYFSPDNYAIVNYLSKASLGNKTVPLQAKVKTPGTYTLSFSQVADFDANIELFLKDNLKNTSTNLRLNNTYLVDLDTSAASMADGRLEIVFTTKANGLNALLAEPKTHLLVYPNPAKESIHLSLSKGSFDGSTIKVFTTTGALVYQNTHSGNSVELNIENLSEGMYFVSVETNQNQVLNTKFSK